MDREQFVAAMTAWRARTGLEPNTVHMSRSTWYSLLRLSNVDPAHYGDQGEHTLMGCRVITSDPEPTADPAPLFEFARIVDTNIDVDATSSAFDMLRTVKQQLEIACRENPNERYDRVVITIEAIRKYLLELRRGVPPATPETEQRSRVVQL